MNFDFPADLLTSNNLPVAIFAAVIAVFVKRSAIFYFILAMLFGPLALLVLFASAFFLSASKPGTVDQAARDRLTRATPETRGAQTVSDRRRAKDAQSREQGERERIRGLLQEMRKHEANKGSGEASTGFLTGVARVLGKEAELDALMKPPASGRREASGASAARESSPARGVSRASERAPTAEERASRRAAEAEARARSRRESHERRHSKMPSSGLSPDDPNFLRGYRPKNNRIP